MGIDAIALVRIPFPVLTARLERLPDDPETEKAGMYPVRGDHGGPFLARPLEDATLIWTFQNFGAAPDELGLALRKLLGAVLDEHQDPRGVLMIPDVAEPRARRYDDLVDEIGEIGTWSPVVDKAHVPKALAEAAPGTVAAQVRDLMTAIPADVFTAMERAARSGDPEAIERARGELEAAMGAVGGTGKWLESFQEALQREVPRKDGGDPGSKG